MIQQEFVHQMARIERRLGNIVQPEISTDLISPYLALTGLRGFWPMSSLNEAGNAYDLSGHSRTLTYNGNPVYGFIDRAPYIGLDGDGDYLNRGDEAGLDIIGTESYMNSDVRGLTMGGWLYPSTETTSLMMGKALDTNGPYQLIDENGTDILFRVRDAGDAANFDVRIAMLLNEWQFTVGRYTPSTEIKVWRNAAVNTNVASIPASLLNGGDDFVIGGWFMGLNYWKGAASLCFLCAAALSDAIINAIFQQTRAAFRV